MITCRFFCDLKIPTKISLDFAMPIKKNSVDVKNFWITNLRGFYIGLGLDIKSLNGKIDFHLVEGS
jgi:hypothetical protein